MLENWKRRRLVVGVLALAIVGVWGAVFYRINTHLSGKAPEQSSDSEAIANVPSQVDPRRSDPPYEGGFRDPFISPLGKEPSESEETSDEASNDENVSQEPEEPEPPEPLRLQVLGRVDSTVLFRGPEGVRLVREGERLDSLQVLEVREGAVVLKRPSSIKDTIQLR